MNAHEIRHEAKTEPASPSQLLLGEIVASGRRIVGFDVTEVVPKLQSGADALVGARMLAKLCAASLKSAQNR